ncbi:MAG: S16 family serine protease [Microbacteriaceae bacterium]
MTTRSPRRTVALSSAAIATLLLSSCSFLPFDLDRSGSSGGGEGSRSGSVSIQPLFTRGDTGGVGSETITREASDDGEFRLDFSEDEVGGLGEASRAASWNAAIISTLLTGQPLSGRFGFEINGAIDGPSAGALKTLALIALQRGDTISETVTMTGTINATGTIGPVGGIPEKIEGAAEAGIETVLVPLGQRNTPNVDGDQVDVVRHGDRLGVEVIEVGDIYDAYGHLTGEELVAPTSSTDPRLDNRSYDKVEAQVTSALGRYEDASRSYSGLSPDIRSFIDETGIPQQAADAADTARDLQRQGLVAGGFENAQEAAALMETVYAASNLLTPLQTQGLAGIGVIVEQASNTRSAESAFTSFVDTLGTYSPETIPDVEALVNAYAGAFDAYTMLDFAGGQLASLSTRIERGDYIENDQFFSELVLALMYAELSKAHIENARAVFEVGRDNPGVGPTDDVDLRQVGDFFRRGADANFAAFESGPVAQFATTNGVSNDVVIQTLSSYDTNVALAVHQQAVLPAFEDYIGGDKPNAAYAAMGYGLNNYVRNQMLVEKYYNNAILDENYQIVGVAFEGALNNAIDLSREQLGAEIGLLREKDAAPVITVALYESGALGGSGDPLERFTALSSYSSGFVTARLLTYLGGWEASRSVG